MDPSLDGAALGFTEHILGAAMNELGMVPDLGTKSLQNTSEGCGLKQVCPASQLPSLPLSFQDVALGPVI